MLLLIVINVYAKIYVQHLDMALYEKKYEDVQSIENQISFFVIDHESNNCSEELYAHLCLRGSV